MRRRNRSRWWTQARLVAAEASAVASAVERALPLLREPNAAVQVWADINSRVSQLRARLGAIGAVCTRSTCQGRDQSRQPGARRRAICDRYRPGPSHWTARPYAGADRLFRSPAAPARHRARADGTGVRGERSGQLRRCPGFRLIEGDDAPVGPEPGRTTFISIPVAIRCCRCRLMTSRACSRLLSAMTIPLSVLRIVRSEICPSERAKVHHFI